MGIDVGGSGFRIGVFNLATGALVGELNRHAHGESTEPEVVLSTIRAVLNAIGWHGPIGMGFPGAVEDGRPTTAPNLGEAWVGHNIGASLEGFHGGRFALINDADAVAVAERQYGAGLEGGTRAHADRWNGAWYHPSREWNAGADLEYGRWPHPTRTGAWKSISRAVPAGLRIKP